MASLPAILDREIELIGVVLTHAAKFRAPVCKDAQQADLVLGKERDHPVVQRESGGDGDLLGMELAYRHAGVGNNEGLLINPPHAHHRANLINVFRPKVAGVVALDLTMGFLFGLSFF